MAEIEFDDITKRYADGFEAAKHSDAAVIEAGVGNGIDVRAGADGGKVRFGA